MTLTLTIERDPDPYGRLRQLIAIQASPDRTPRLGRLRMPALVIHGLADKLVLPSGGIATARAIPGSRLLMFPDMAHDLPRTRIPEIVAAIADNAARAGADAPGRPDTGRPITDRVAAPGTGQESA